MQYFFMGGGGEGGGEGQISCIKGNVKVATDHNLMKE